MVWVGLALLGACAAPRTGVDPNQPMIDAVARVLPAVVDLDVVAAGPAATRAAETSGRDRLCR